MSRSEHGPALPWVAELHNVVQDPQPAGDQSSAGACDGYHDLTEQISVITEGDVFKTPLKYWITLSITGSIVLMLGAMLTYLVSTGIGVWGNNRPVGWAWDITNFVFWIGIGHAGTLISAILFLFRQKWRTSINRSAEAMTLFAVACAGIFRCSILVVHGEPTGCFLCPIRI